MKNLDIFFEKLWQQYTAITPQALAIHELLKQRESTLVNDHVAFRTFSNSPYSISQLEPELLNLGFRAFDDYQFEKKKLLARSYVHKDSPTKIFLSELVWQELSISSQKIISKIIEEKSTSKVLLKKPISLSSGRLWSMPSFDDYLVLLNESEYAAWLSVWGLRANHFTIYINYLSQYMHLESVIELLENHQYLLNKEGGVIKGTPQDYLIQASTMADKQPVKFPDGNEHIIASCYYEFAQRFKQPDGAIYQGFVPSSADKIFESTNINK